MSEPLLRPLRHPLLDERGIDHGFGVRGWLGPAGLVRPRQVHGIAVAVAGPGGALDMAEADAVLSSPGGPPVGVVTADCVPILLGASDGRAVGAIHAGWRGLAAGVIGAAITLWQRRNGALEGVCAVIGPHAGPCCYEIDAPVFDAFSGLDDDLRATAFRASRPGHWMFDLGVPVRDALRRAGIAESAIGATEETCTVCDGVRFESYRREGPSAGRLVHAITPRSSAEAPGDPAGGGAGAPEAGDRARDGDPA